MNDVASILEQAAILAAARHSDFDDEVETRRKLNAHGLSDDEIARQLSTLRANTAGSTGVLTSYSLLHSLQHLDSILEESHARGVGADAAVTIFRCAEICIYNIAILSKKMQAAIQSGDVGRVATCARWRAGFHEVLYRLSSLVAEVSGDTGTGDILSIQSSSIFRLYRENLATLHDTLRNDWPEADADIFGRDLDDPKRFVFFNEFASVSDERVWLSRLRSVRVAGSFKQDGETDDEFHERVVGTSELQRMMEALETTADTDLLSFRAIHQVSEVIASHINVHLCKVITGLVSAERGNLTIELRTLVISNRMLSIVDDVIKLLMRALTPAAYKIIRPNLGMVRGTSSVVLRKTLFNATYPLLVYAFRLRIAGFSSMDADRDEAVFANASVLLASDDTHAVELSQIMRELVVFHQHIRTWRDNHQQFPKTHLGMSPFAGRPTVSLSGSGSGVDIAHGLRKTHGSDPVAPIYRAVMGVDVPAVHDLLQPGGFEEHMAHATARAVMDTYADVQQRFYDRTRKHSSSHT